MGQKKDVAYGVNYKNNQVKGHTCKYTRNSFLSTSSSSSPGQVDQRPALTMSSLNSLFNRSSPFGTKWFASLSDPITAPLLLQFLFSVFVSDPRIGGFRCDY